MGIVLELYPSFAITNDAITQVYSSTSTFLASFLSVGSILFNVRPADAIKIAIDPLKDNKLRKKVSK